MFYVPFSSCVFILALFFESESSLLSPWLSPLSLTRPTSSKFSSSSPTRARTKRRVPMSRLIVDKDVKLFLSSTRFDEEKDWRLLAHFFFSQLSPSKKMANSSPQIIELGTTFRGSPVSQGELLAFALAEEVKIRDLVPLIRVTRHSSLLHFSTLVSLEKSSKQKEVNVHWEWIR